MIFSLNGVIRSNSNEEIEHELKKHLIGKKMVIEKDKFVVSNVSLDKSLLIIFHDEGSSFIKKIKKIEIEKSQSIIRVFTKDNIYYIGI